MAAYCLCNVVVTYCQCLQVPGYAGRNGELVLNNLVNGSGHSSEGCGFADAQYTVESTDAPFQALFEGALGGTLLA